ncbi:MAG: methyl-accepting chemotaxis protein [Schwartzia sp. (in: firmicutes)]
MSLRQKMLLSIGVPLLVIFFAMSVFVYRDAGRRITEGTQRQMEALAQFHAEEIHRMVDSKTGLLDGLAEGWAGGFPDNARFLKIAEDFSKRPDIAFLYAGFPDRDFLTNGDGVVPRAEFDATTRDWYKKAAAKDGIQISEVYEDAFTKKKVVTLSRALKTNGRLTGVVAIDVLFSVIEDKILSLKIGEHGEAFLLDDQGRFIAHAHQSINDNIKSEGEDKANRFLTKTPSFFENTFMGTTYYYVVYPVEGTGWNLVLFTPKDEVLADVAQLKWMMLIGSIVSLTVLGIILFMTAQSIAGPIEAVNQVAAEVAKGDLSRDLRPTDRQDEIGSLHNSFCTMADGLKKLITTTVETAQQLAAASEELTASADQSAQGAQHTAEAITKITGDTVEQDAVVDESMETVDGITSAMNEITGSIADVSAAAQRVETATVEGQQGLNVAVRGMEVLDESSKGVADAVTALYESSKRISEIVEMISSIAGQTNLLALNAAIEAARAGEQGRGFAVVAEEVRKLAEQSANSSQEITALITDNANRIENTFKVMQEQKERVEEGVAQVNQASEKFDRIAAVVKELAAQIDTIHQSTEGIKSGSERMVGSVEAIKKVSASVHSEAENVAAVSEEQAASMEEIASASQTLAQMAQDLQKGVGRFRV